MSLGKSRDESQGTGRDAGASKETSDADGRRVCRAERRKTRRREKKKVRAEGAISASSCDSRSFFSGDGEARDVQDGIIVHALRLPFWEADL